MPVPGFADVSGAPSTDALGEKLYNYMTEATDSLGEWRNEAMECYDIVAGRQWTDEDLSRLQDLQRIAMTFNYTELNIEAVRGHQINNRQEIAYTAREPGDAQVNEILSGAAKWLEEQCGGEFEVSEAFWDLLISGMGFTHTYVDDSEDVEDRLVTAERIPTLEMLWDPTAYRRNLQDARWLARSRWMDRDWAEGRWGEIPEGDISRLAWELDREDVHRRSRIGYEDKVNDELFNLRLNEVFISQIQYYQYEPFVIIPVPEQPTMDPQGQPVQKPPKLQRFPESEYRQSPLVGVIPIRRKIMKRWYEAFLVGPHVLQSAPMETDVSTLLAMTGRRDQTKNRWYGLVRAIKDPQRWANRFLSLFQDMVAAGRKGGAYVEDDAIDDIDEFEEDFAKVGGIVSVRPGALTGGKVQDRPMPEYPQAIDRLLEFSVTGIQQVAGINPEFLGMLDRNQPGVVEAQRKQASVGNLAGFFDALRSHTQVRGRVMLTMIRTHISDGRLIRIVGDNGLAQYVSLVRDKDTAEYDVVTDESPHSVSIREQTWAVLKDLFPVITQMGLTPPPAVLDYLPLPASLVDKIKQSMAPSPEQQQEEAQKKQLNDAMMYTFSQLQAAQAAKAAAEVALTKAKTELTQAQATVQAQTIDPEVIGAEVETVKKLIDVVGGGDDTGTAKPPGGKP